MKKFDQTLYDELYQQALKKLRDGEVVEVIEQHLLQSSDDIILITVVVKEAKNTHYALLRKQGFRLVLLGCIIGLSGFFITFINFNTARSIDFAMYGLTSLGLAIVFFGLFKIIG